MLVAALSLTLFTLSVTPAMPDSSEEVATTESADGTAPRPQLSIPKDADLHARVEMNRISDHWAFEAIARQLETFLLSLPQMALTKRLLPDLSFGITEVLEVGMYLRSEDPEICGFASLGAVDGGRFEERLRHISTETSLRFKGHKLRRIRSHTNTAVGNLWSLLPSQTFVFGHARPLKTAARSTEWRPRRALNTVRAIIDETAPVFLVTRLIGPAWRVMRFPRAFKSGDAIALSVQAGDVLELRAGFVAQGRRSRRRAARFFTQLEAFIGGMKFLPAPVFARAAGVPLRVAEAWLTMLRHTQTRKNGAKVVLKVRIGQKHGAVLVEYARKLATGELP